MKLLFTILLIIPTIVYTQNIDFNFAEYKLYKVNKSSVSYSESGIKDKFDTINYGFVLNENEAFFSANKKILNEQSTQINLSEILIESFGNYYYDYKKSKVYNLKEFQGKLFSIVNNFDYLKWNIYPEVIQINGFKCKRAVYSKKENSIDGKSNDYSITVWFSDQIDSRFSPFGLTRLPGGVVKVDFNNFVQVIIGKRKKVKDLKMKPNKFGEIVTDKEFDKIQNDFFENQRKHRNSGIDKS